MITVLCNHDVTKRFKNRPSQHENKQLLLHFVKNKGYTSRHFHKSSLLLSR